MTNISKKSKNNKIIMGAILFIISITIIVYSFILNEGWMLMIRMPGVSYKGVFLPLSKEEHDISNHLLHYVTVLTNDIGERHLNNPHNLEKSKEFIMNEFREIGLTISLQSFKTEGIEVSNVIGEKKGEKSGEEEEIIVIGAHYDTVPKTPGADDNASGVAAMLEIAKLLKNNQYSKTIHFVAFVNEEPPYFYSPQMGSWQYANEAHQKKKKIVAMLSLESLGFYSEEKKTQFYPFPLNFFYPSEANFIGFVGNVFSRQLVHRCIDAFRKNTKFPSEGIAAPSIIPGIGWSDQWAFWRFGYKAVMITDTALFRNPNYHLPSDTIGTLDFHRFSRVVLGLTKMINEICE